MSSPPPVLAAADLTFSYGSTRVLDGVSLAVAPGEFVALAGPNGSGKSTLLRLLLGLTTPESGSVELLGAPPTRLAERWRLGYVPQRAIVPEHLPATVEEVVAAGCLSRRGWRRGLRAGDRVDVAHALESVALTERAGDPLRELSGGQQQRVLIAKALVSRPDLLILDEPVAGVDTESQRQFRDALVHLVHDHGSAVLLVSHELGAVATDLDRVLVLRRGRIVFDGPPADLESRGVSLGVHRDDLPLWLEG
ncbi:MAG TPA: metal ABC transporter ATP-binding protein [Acidimicrobiales bacterium]|nr:metal ABC transporter ATP-binding protein [Acidimicrobiales bacterium]